MMLHKHFLLLQFQGTIELRFYQRAWKRTLVPTKSISN